MSQVEILAGRINTLLDGLWMLVYAVGAVAILVCALMIIAAGIYGDWTVRLALVSWIGFTLVAAFLAPLVPFGSILGWVIMVLGFSVAVWLTAYH